MKKTIKLIFICYFFLNFKSYTQVKLRSSDLKEMMKDEVKINIDRKRREFYISKEKRDNNKQISFYFRSDDSLSAYLNDSLIYSNWIKYSEKPYASYNQFIFFKVPRINTENFITIVLNKRKRFIKFKLKKNFYFVNVYYLQNENNDFYWKIIFSNNIPGG